MSDDGRKRFRDLAARTMSPDRIARAEVKVAAALEEMNLAQVRRARALSQEAIAETLQVGQAAVAKLEKRTDMYLSTLRRFVEAMGGELELVARFPDHAVRIRHIADIGAEHPGQDAA
jgi:DNA-binding XRE family transcriptional regulator